ncbi:MAG: helix-turn-helix transcriptional regulator [Parvibaculaceae bacterium]
MNPIERALGIVLALSGTKLVPAAELSRHFEVSIRTIYRDMDRLLRLGVPVEGTRGNEGGYKLAEGYLQPPVGLTREETAALLVALALVRGLKATPLASELDTAEKKLLLSLPSAARALLKDGSRIVGVEAAPEDIFHWEKEVSKPLDGGPAVDAFITGILKGRRVRLLYENPYRNTVREHEVEPQGILFDRDRWYLIGRSLEYGDERLWRADKAHTVTVSGLAFRPDREFTVQRYTGRAWLAAGMARWLEEDRRSVSRIRLTPALAGQLKRDWFYRQARFTEEEGGAILMEVPEVDPRSILPLMRWLGPDAELIAPEELRVKVAEEALKLAERHSRPVAGIRQRGGRQRQ